MAMFGSRHSKNTQPPIDINEPFTTRSKYDIVINNAISTDDYLRESIARYYILYIDLIEADIGGEYRAETVSVALPTGELPTDIISLSSAIIKYLNLNSSKRKQYHGRFRAIEFRPLNDKDTTLSTSDNSWEDICKLIEYPLTSNKNPNKKPFGDFF
jgi:hypothetical protein